MPLMNPILSLSLPEIILDQPLRTWLQEDIGRGDWTTIGLGPLAQQPGQAIWVAKEAGVVAGLPIAARAFQLLDASVTMDLGSGGGGGLRARNDDSYSGRPLSALLMGERVALNLAMRLSGIATATRQYVECLADYPTQLVDTRKTTPGLRLLEKYATRVGGALNHRMGLDDAVMIKDNHIALAGDIQTAVAQVRQANPYPLAVEVETSSVAQVKAALAAGIDIIMLDNMALETMKVAVEIIRETNPQIKIEASGNVTLDTLRPIAATGVDFISSSAPITRAPWLDLSMCMAG
ncbi:MAG: carboxylating nicotinate-nucleotide diphosphorylase [Leptolyngbyaceae cyanobacterium SM2_3_12]|nr:carboxylating nicotinate-nucleotide diphosphorylase [Leptolyngbyaceae cyanobacterium SM2_3_12]